MKSSRRAPRASGSAREPQSLSAVAVLREPVFSPGMVDHDAAIVRASAEKLATLRGVPCPVLNVVDLAALDEVPDLILNMAEGEDTLALLEGLEQRGALVLNSTVSVRATRRAALLDLAAPRGPLVEGVLVETDDGDRIPPGFLASGSAWVKRADYHALGPGDVVRAAAADVKATLRGMRARGIQRAVVQPHVVGEVVKFYGVVAPTVESTAPTAEPISSDAFFRWFATDGGKGPDAAQAERLRTSALEAARRAGLSIFGGDAVLPAGQPGATPVVIDLNAWPSFWRCRDEAAQAIARLALAQLEAIAAGPASPGRRAPRAAQGGAA